MNWADFLLGLTTGAIAAFLLEVYRAWRRGKHD
jgi:hypothetical protein